MHLSFCDVDADLEREMKRESKVLNTSLIANDDLKLQEGSVPGWLPASVAPAKQK